MDKALKALLLVGLLASQLLAAGKPVKGRAEWPTEGRVKSSHVER